VVKVGDGPGVEGLEATALGRSEVVGKGEGGEVVEGAADLPEAALVLDGAGGDCGGSRLGAQPAERVAQQLSAVGLVGAAEELDQAQGLAPGQTVALGAIEDLVLVLVAERAQGVRERRADGAPGQPLLRGAGHYVNTSAIRIAGYEARMAEARTRLEVTRVLASVDRAYWRLYAARREVDVRRMEYDLAGAQLDTARRLVGAGEKPDIEILRADSARADRFEGVLIAESAARDRERELKKVQSEAYKTAQEIIGKADAEATTIYASAYNRSAESREFYRFLKTMETYRTTMSEKDWLVLSTKGDFFGYLQDLRPK